jgi:hypothetical protein
MRRLRRRSLIVLVALALVAQVVAMAPINASESSRLVVDPSAVPDPPATPPFIPPELQTGSALPAIDGLLNHVRKLDASEVAALAEAGVRVAVNEEGLLQLDVGDAGERTRIALYDTHTQSGIAVVGLGFLNESEIESLDGSAGLGRFGFGPQAVLADMRWYDHTHALGPPFHSCSYLYQYAGNSRDAYVYICPVDVGNIRWVGSAMASLLGVVSGNPLLAFLGVLVANIGISFFQENDGSIRLYVPGSASVNHYGWTYYYSRYSYWEDWYYHNPTWSAYYCYATKYSNGYRYYECP